MLTTPAAIFHPLLVVLLLMAANAAVPTMVVAMTTGIPSTRFQLRVLSACSWCPNWAVVIRRCHSSSRRFALGPR